MHEALIARLRELAGVTLDNNVRSALHEAADALAGNPTPSAQPEPPAPQPEPPAPEPTAT